MKLRFIGQRLCVLFRERHTAVGEILFLPRDQEGRADDPVNRSPVGNPIKGFPEKYDFV